MQDRDMASLKKCAQKEQDRTHMVHKKHNYTSARINTRK